MDSAADRDAGETPTQGKLRQSLASNTTSACSTTMQRQTDGLLRRRICWWNRLGKAGENKSVGALAASHSSFHARSETRLVGSEILLRPKKRKDRRRMPNPTVSRLIPFHREPHANLLQRHSFRA